MTNKIRKWGNIEENFGCLLGGTIVGIFHYLDVANDEDGLALLVETPKEVFTVFVVPNSREGQIGWLNYTRGLTYGRGDREDAIWLQDYPGYYRSGDKTGYGNIDFEIYKACVDPDADRDSLLKALAIAKTQLDGDREGYATIECVPVEIWEEQMSAAIAVLAKKLHWATQVKEEI